MFISIISCIVVLSFSLFSCFALWVFCVLAFSFCGLCFSLCLVLVYVSLLCFPLVIASCVSPVSGSLPHPGASKYLHPACVVKSVCSLRPLSERPVRACSSSLLYLVSENSEVSFGLIGSGSGFFFVWIVSRFWPLLRKGRFFLFVCFFFVVFLILSLCCLLLGSNAAPQFSNITKDASCNRKHNRDRLCIMWQWTPCVNIFNRAREMTL